MQEVLKTKTTISFPPQTLLSQTLLPQTFLSQTNYRRVQTRGPDSVYLYTRKPTGQGQKRKRKRNSKKAHYTPAPRNRTHADIPKLESQIRSIYAPASLLFSFFNGKCGSSSKTQSLKKNTLHHERRGSASQNKGSDSA